MCSRARDPRRRADPDPVAAVVGAAAVAAVAAMVPVLETLQIDRKWKETPIIH